MKRSLSIFFAAAPFAFGLIRYFQTGQDMRMLWMSLAAYVGAALVMSLGKARTRAPGGILAFSVVILVIATLLATLTGYLLGATAGPGVWMVAFVLGLCCAAAYAFYTRTQQI